MEATHRQTDRQLDCVGAWCGTSPQSAVTMTADCAVPGEDDVVGPFHFLPHHHNFLNLNLNLKTLHESPPPAAGGGGQARKSRNPSVKNVRSRQGVH